MSRTRLISLSFLAALVLSAVVLVSASAEPPPPSGSCTAVGTPSYCVAGVPLVNASENIEGTNSGASILKGTIGSVTSEVKCEKGKLTGTIEGGAAGTVGKSTGKMTFEECKLVTPANCKLTTKKIETTELKDELELTGSGKRIEDKFEPKDRQRLCLDRFRRQGILVRHCSRWRRKAIHRVGIAGVRSRYEQYRSAKQKRSPTN